MQDAKLVITNLSCMRLHHFLFSNLSLEINARDICLIRGANGSGKSSLLRILSGLKTPSDGDVKWNNRSIHTHFAEYKNALHYVGHNNGIKLDLTVSENLQLFQHISLTTKSDDLIKKILISLQLIDAINTPAKYLSAGQKRKLTLSKLFIYPKKIWILDEPLTALDASTQFFFFEQLEQHIVNNGIVIMSSHQPLPIAVTTNIELGIC